MEIENLKKVDDVFVNDKGDIVLRIIDNMMYEYKDGNYYLYKEFNNDTLTDCGKIENENLKLKEDYKSLESEYLFLKSVNNSLKNDIIINDSMK